MSKTFTCCELVKWVKQFLNKNPSDDKDKYQFLEFLHKSATKITNKRIKEWKTFNGKKEPVWTCDEDYLFCEECKKWFKQQEEPQMKLIDAEIEKEIAEGTFHSNPITQRILAEFDQKAARWKKEIEERNLNSLPFGKSPQE